MTIKTWETVNPEMWAPAIDAKAVTTSDTVDLPNGYCRSLWVGVLGDVAVITQQGTVVTFVGVQGILPVICKRVMATGTTGTSIVALY